MLVQAATNLLAGIRPTVKSEEPKLLGSKERDPACSYSGGVGDLDYHLQTWAFELRSQEDINTVSIFFKDKPERTRQIEIRVGPSSNIAKNPQCAVSETQAASDPGGAWLACGLRGNFVSATFCGDDGELEIRAFSQHRISLRKVVSRSAQLEGDHSSIAWVSQSGLPSSSEKVFEGSILAFKSAILISYTSNAQIQDVSQSFPIFVAYAQLTQYPCEPINSKGAYREVFCDLRGDGIILDLAGEDFPDSIFVLSSSDPATVNLDLSSIFQHQKNQQRQLQSCTGAGCGYCQNPTSMLNLLNTSVIAQQSSYYPDLSQTAVTACDGVVFPINQSTYAIDERKIVGSTNNGPSQYWKATFTATTSIKSSLIIHRDECCKWRPLTMTSTFGNNQIITSNPIFMPVGSMADGGWFVCQNAMTGTIFAVYQATDYLDFVEIMLYSQEPIQMNALSALATDPSVNFPATNALQKIVVLLATLSTQKCVQATASATAKAKVEIKLKAFGKINGVAALPGYKLSASSWPMVQKNVAISVNNVGNTNQLCGVMSDFYIRYSEVTCNVFANQIIIEQETAGGDLALCGLGVFSDCNCAESSFEPASFTTAPTATLVSANSMTKFVGDTTAKTVTVSIIIPDTVSTLCGNGDGTTKCGLRSIKFYDSSNVEIVVWPYLGVLWDSTASTISLPGTYQTPGTFTIDVEISLTSNSLVKLRQTITITVAVNNQYCKNPLGMLNLLDTNVIAEQSSYWPTCSQTPVTACDGIVFLMDTSTFTIDNTKLSHSGRAGSSQYWKATFSATTSIKSSLIIHRDGCCKSRPPTWISTFGNDQVITSNPIFMPIGSMTDGGWYNCQDSMTGTIFAIYSATNYFDFVEVLLYSQEAIQMNALSAVAMTRAGFPATNALQNIVVLLAAELTQKCIQTEGSPSKLEINLKAYGHINGVALFPGYSYTSDIERDNWRDVQNNIAVSVNKVGNTKQLCGVMGNYYATYKEVACNIVGNQIIFEQLTPGKRLRLCGVGVLSDCECAQSSFDPVLITSAVSTAPFASVTTLSLLPTDSSQTIKFNHLIPDTVSSICGKADGFTKCGLRKIIFTEKSSGFVITSWPYDAYDWNPESSTLIVKPASATTANSVLTATLSLVSQPKVIYSQEITVNVANVPLIKSPLFLANQSLNAVINQEATLLLPDFGVNSSYALTGTQTFSVILEGTKLTVLSSNLADVGTQQLTISLLKSTQIVNFQVNVIFSTENQDNKTAAEGSTSQVASAVLPYQPKKSSKKKQEIPVIALPLLRPQIKFITNMALVNVTFNGNISANISKEQIQVRYIQNSNEIDQRNTFKWKITEVNTTWEENFVLIQLNYTHPILVSQGNKPDMLEVLYRNDYLYPLGKEAPFVDLNFTTVTSIMPMLAPSAEQAEMIDTISLIAADAAQGSFYTFLVAYLILSTVMKYVWQTFNTLQIILVFPMLMVKMPVNVTNVQDSFKKIVNLDFIDKKKVYKVICEPLFGEIIESIKNPDSDSSGELLAERSKNLVLQIVILAAFVIVIVALMVSLLVIRICAQKIKNQMILNAYKSLESKVMFSSVLRYGIQEYLKLSLTTLITFHDFSDADPVQGRLLESADVDQQPDVKKMVISTLLTVFLILYPPFCVWFLRRYEIILYMQVMKMRFGTMYVGLNYYKRSSLVYLTIFLARRLVFAVIIVYVTVNVQLQLLLSMYCSMFMLYYLIVYMPMWDLALNLIFLFNEGCLFICSALMFLFTEYVPTPEDRFTLGWFYLGVVGFNVVGNGVYVIFDIQQQIKQRIYYKKEIQRKIQAREDAKDLAIKVLIKKRKEEAKLEGDDWSEVSEAEIRDPEKVQEKDSVLQELAPASKEIIELQNDVAILKQEREARELQKLEQEKSKLAEKLKKEQKKKIDDDFERQMADIENGRSGLKYKRIDVGEGLVLFFEEEEKKEIPKRNFDIEISRDYEQIVAKERSYKLPVYQTSGQLSVEEWTAGAAQASQEDVFDQRKENKILPKKEESVAMKLIRNEREIEQKIRQKLGEQGKPIQWL